MMIISSCTDAVYARRLESRSSWSSRFASATRSLISWRSSFMTLSTTERSCSTVVSSTEPRGDRPVESEVVVSRSADEPARAAATALGCCAAGRLGGFGKSSGVGREAGGPGDGGMLAARFLSSVVSKISTDNKKSCTIGTWSNVYGCVWNTCQPA